jgi:D-alanyl-D-alanine endopeptidase (penicillin-binding protein 7)
MIREVLMGGFCGVSAGRTVSLVRLLCAAVCMVSAPSFAAGKTSGLAAAPSASKAAVKVSGKSQGGAAGSTATPSAAPSARKRDGASADRRASDQRPTDKRASVSASRAPTQTGGRTQPQPVNTSERRGKQDLRPQARDARGQRDARVEKAALSGKAAASGSRAGARTADAGTVHSARWMKASFAPRIVEPARVSIGQAIGLHQVGDPLELRSSVAMVLDQQTGQTLYQKNADAVLPIASITKVMTAMVVLDAALDPSEVIAVVEADRDTERFSGSRLPIGSRLTRSELMQLSLMSSENRAAYALGRTYPGGLKVFIDAMNAKARAIGMEDTRFADPTGLSSDNVSNARDLARMVRAAHAYGQIRRFSTATDLTVDLGPRQSVFRSTNRLVDAPGWDIGLQKTGYISEAGKCLVMQARVDSREVIIVLLDAAGSQSRFADAQRLRKWLLERPNDAAQSQASPQHNAMLVERF